MKKGLIIVGILAVVLTLGFFAYRSFTKSYSPPATATFNKEGLELKVEYCRPYKKERQIFGALVPFGEVWRTGANEATEITFNKDVNFGGKAIKAGRYALFTIPNKDKWTIILNSELGQWGAFNYNPEKDVLRTDVPVISTPGEVEMFTIDFKESDGALNMILAWDTTRVEVPIKPV